MIILKQKKEMLFKDNQEQEIDIVFSNGKPKLDINQSNIAISKSFEKEIEYILEKYPGIVDNFLKKNKK